MKEKEIEIFKTFNAADWECFSGAEAQQPVITYDRYQIEGLDTVAVIDADSIQLHVYDYDKFEDEEVWSRPASGIDTGVYFFISDFGYDPTKPLNLTRSSLEDAGFKKIS